jgi:hypothetical protein
MVSRSMLPRPLGISLAFLVCAFMGCSISVPDIGRETDAAAAADDGVPTTRPVPPGTTPTSPTPVDGGPDSQARDASSPPTTPQGPTPPSPASVLVARAGAMDGMVVQNRFIYVLYKSGVVARVATSGGTFTTLSTTPTPSDVGEPAPEQLAVNASHVYWGVRRNRFAIPPTTGKIYRVPVAGGATEIVVDGLVAPVGIALDATTLYFSDGGARTVGKAPLAGGSAATTLATGLAGMPGSIATDSDSVYWASNQTNRTASDGGIAKLSINGGAPVMITTGFPSVGAIELGASEVYFYGYWPSPHPNDNLYVAPKAGGAARTLGNNNVKSPSFSIDGTYAYFADPVGTYAGGPGDAFTFSRTLKTPGPNTEPMFDYYPGGFPASKTVVMANDEDAVYMAFADKFAQHEFSIRKVPKSIAQTRVLR